MKIGLATPPIPKSINDGLHWVEKLAKDAAAQNAEIICFPESFIPGYPAAEYEIAKSTPENCNYKIQPCVARFCRINYISKPFKQYY